MATNKAPAPGLPAQQEVDRRRAGRASVFLPATIFFVERVVEARILNASASGLMAEADVELNIGQHVHFSFDALTYHGGTVQWATGRRFGQSLANALALITGQAKSWQEQSGQHEARAVRIGLDFPAHLYLSKPPRPATVRNISASGMLLDSGPDLRPGQLLLVSIRDRGCVSGRVQWADGGRAGFRSEASLADKLPLGFGFDGAKLAEY
jgi:hypothetical protein